MINRGSENRNTGNTADGERSEKKKPFLRSGAYDVSDVNEAAKNAYDTDMSEEELKSRRTRDWLFILIGIPALIGLTYLIVMISR